MRWGRLRAYRHSFPGPVFRRELRTASRGWRIYLFRGLAAGALAAYVASDVSNQLRFGGSEFLTTRAISEMASRAFRVFAASQLVLVLAMVPFLVAGSLADEKARGTLGLLLAGRLSSAEIVADKLAAKMLLIVVLMIAGLPVLAIIGMLGGIDPAELLIAYGLTLSSAWFVASLSMLVSVYARSASGAVVAAFLAMVGWLVPAVSFMNWLASTGRTGFLAAIQPLVREVARSSPLSIANSAQVWGPKVMTAAGRLSMFQEMAGLQVAGGLILFAMAAWRLRPVYRAQASGVRGSRLSWLARMAGLRGRSKPACGDDPMAWKERYAAESSWLARLTILGAISLVAYSTIDRLNWDRAELRAFDEMFTYGSDLGTWGQHGGYRNGMNYSLTSQAALVYVASLVASSILAASSVAGERSRETWTALLSTPLERRSILRAKRRGAIRAIRIPLVLIVFFYLASLASTAMHPVGFVLGVSAVVAFLRFGVALGTYVSLRSKNANQAIGRTAVILLAVNLGPSALIYACIGGPAMMITTPMLATELPVSPMRARMVMIAAQTEPVAAVLIAVAMGIVLAHAVGAWLLTRAADRRIERDQG